MQMNHSKPSDHGDHPYRLSLAETVAIGRPEKRRAPTSRQLWPGRALLRQGMLPHRSLRFAENGQLFHQFLRAGEFIDEEQQVA